MNTFRAVLTAVLCSLVLSLITRELNHAFSGAALSVFTFGIPVAFAALRLDFGSGWKAMIVAGLLADSLAPVRFGLHAALFLITFLLIHRFRHRVPREEALVGTVFAVLTNAVLFLGISLALVWQNPAPGRLVSRLLSEVALSSLLILLVAPWFFALCEHSLSWAGVDLRREKRSLL